jgi:hypothetical protein
MDESKKRTVLESILKSEKIVSAYNRHKGSNKLNKKLIIERIMAEIDGLWARFNDVNKLNRFLESFISNHIKDFLIPRKANDLESVVATNTDKRVDEDPNERLKREIEERKKSKIVIQTRDEVDEVTNSGDSKNSGDNLEEFQNEENMAEKNETSNLETMMNRNNFQQMPMQMHPQQQMSQHMPQQMHPNMMAHQQQMPPHMMQQNMPQQMQQQMHPNMMAPQQQMPPHMMPQNMPQQMPQQMHPNMMAPQQQMPPHMPQNMPQNMQQQMNPNMAHPQQQNRNFTTKPVVSTPTQSTTSNNTVPVQSNVPVQVPLPASMATPANIPAPAPAPIQQEPDRSVIHIDSRERNIVECPKSNPFSIYMNDGTTCVVCVRDLVTTNIHNDQYLLVQISENNKSVYENQVNREVHFKLVRVHKDDSCAYYKNTDMDTMIRLRDISKITFNIIRPNGKLLYSYVNDIREAASLEEDKLVELVEANHELKDKNIEVLETVLEHLEVGDLVTVFEKDVDSGSEAKVLTINKENNRVVLEHLDNSFTGGNNKRILLNKFQVSISLEII